MVHFKKSGSRISVISSSQLQQTEFFFYPASALPFGLRPHPLPSRGWALLPLPNCMQAVFPSLPQLHHIRTDFCFPLHSPLSPVPTLARGGSSLPLFNCMQTISALIPHSFLGIDVVVYMTPPLPLHFPIVPALQLTPTRGGA